jgi:hypothetical protein
LQVYDLLTPRSLPTMDGNKSSKVAGARGEKRKRESESKVSTSARKSKAFIGEDDQAVGKAAVGEPKPKPQPKKPAPYV